MTSCSARLCRLALVLVLAAFSLSPAPASAQVPPVLIIGDASVFEGNSGSTLLTFPVTLTGPTTATVAAQFSAIPLTGSGFNAATGGATCTAGVDFRQVSGVPFSMAPGTTSTTISVEICGDTTIELDEHIFVALTSVSGAQCLEGTCNGVGTIRNDDGPPRVSINNVSVSEGLSGSRTTSLTVSLSHPSQSNTSVNFATRSGTAVAGDSCSPTLGTFATPDYVRRSGTLVIPAGSLTGPIAVTICGDSRSEPDETFFVDLSNPSPAGVTILDGTGQGTIRNTGLLIDVGEFEVTPDLVQVHAGELLVYTIVWEVPAGQVWRDLRTIDVRIRGGKTALWVRWDEHFNTFSLCEHGKGAAAGPPDPEDRGVSCGAGVEPGSPFVLAGDLAQLYAANSSVVGSGPTGATVTLQLAVAFPEKAEGHGYEVELAAADDFGQQDGFRDAATVRVLRLDE